MNNILCIDTSTDICSVVLGNKEGVLYERVSYEGRDHSAKAGVFVDEILKEAKSAGIEKPDAVAVCSGPGSYTGLRIGISLSKGLCYGFDIPLIAVDSLQVMARQVVDRCGLANDCVLCPMIDARRMEVYTSLWDSAMNLLQEPEAIIIDESFFAEYVGQPFFYFGTGAEKCQDILKAKGFEYLEGIAPMAHSLLVPALDCYAQQQFQDVAYFEPFYLKQFQTTVSTKNVLNR